MYLSSKDKTKLSIYFKTQPVLKAYLFGSFARGEGDEQSDIDLVLELDHTHPIGLQYFGIKLDLEELLQKKVDILTPNSISKYIQSYIQNEMQLIYER